MNNHKYTITSKGLGCLYIYDTVEKKTVAASVTWKGIKEKWFALTGETFVEEPYES